MTHLEEYKIHTMKILNIPYMQTAFDASLNNRIPLGEVISNTSRCPRFITISVKSC